MEVGYFGKLPGLGDFLQRNVAPELVQSFEDWIYPAFEATIQTLGPAWQQHYFTSPIWRFVVPAGLWHTQAVTGFMMPSIDKASRCFPFVVICQATSNVNPLLWAMQLDAQHQQAENLALDLLEVVDPDQLSLQQCLQQIYADFSEAQCQSSAASAMTQSNETQGSEIQSFALLNQDLVASHFDLLQHAYAQQLCCWWTSGGPEHPARIHYYHGLPSAAAFSNLICNETF